MAECIEREVVMQKFADHVKQSNNSDFAPVPTWNQAVQIVEDCPAADVVEVVRCKDCIQHVPDSCLCRMVDWKTRDEDFCSFAVKRRKADG